MSWSETLSWVASGTLTAAGGVMGAIVCRGICALYLRASRPWRSTSTLWTKLRRSLRSEPTVVNVAEYQAALSSLGLTTHATEEQLADRMRQGDHVERGIGAWLFLSTVVPTVPWMATAFFLAYADDLRMSFHVGMGGLTFFTAGLLHKTYFATHVARGLEAPRLLSPDIGEALLQCQAVADGHGDALRLDDRVGLVIRTLRAFSKHGHEGADPQRRAEYVRHTQRVCGALHDSVGRVLADGGTAVPELALLLHTVSERATQGRWLGLLDEADLPGPSPLEPSGTRRRRITEATVVLLLTAGAAGVVIGAMALHVPVQYASVVGLAVFLGGGLAWRGSRVGVTSRSMFSTIGAAFAPQQEPPAPPGGPAPAPDATTRQTGGGPG